jgi:hypothetical protein
MRTWRVSSAAAAGNERCFPSCRKPTAAAVTLQAAADTGEASAASLARASAADLIALTRHSDDSVAATLHAWPIPIANSGTQIMPYARYTSLLIAGFLALATANAYARDFKAGSIDVIDPWSRATPKGSDVGIGYMKIANTGTTPDKLLSASSDIAPSVQVHTMTMDNGVAQMRPVTDGLEIKPGETVELKPDSLHMMFVGLKKPLVMGEHIKAILVFEKAGSLNVELDVLGMGAQAPGGGMNAMPGMNMGH